MEDVYIHILINKPVTFEKQGKYSIKNTNIKDINYVWYRINNKAEFDNLTEITESEKPEYKIVWFLSNISLLPEVASKSDVYIALTLEQLKENDILRYKEIFNNYISKIYIVDETPANSIGVTDRSFKSINEKINFLYTIIKNLKEAGVNKIVYTRISNSETEVVDSIDLYRTIKQKLGISVTVCFRYFNDRDRVVLENSLLLGNLFYEGIAESVLINYEDVWENPEYIDDSFNLAKTILGSLDLIKVGYKIISCPKCGRCQMDLLKINREVDSYLRKLETEYNQKGVYLEDLGGITVAVMGCNVNGPGEARGADIGIAGGKNGKGTIFKYGIPFETLSEDKVVEKFLKHVKDLIDKKISDSGMKIA